MAAVWAAMLQGMGESTRRGCTSECFYSTGPASKCTCACGGEFHGKGAGEAPAAAGGGAVVVGGQAFVPVERPSDSVPASAPELDNTERVWNHTRMSTTDYAFERETDERLAQLSYEQYRTLDKIDQLQASIINATNPPYYYRGTQRVTDRTFPEAHDLLTDALAAYDAQTPEAERSDWDTLDSLRGTERFGSAPTAERARRLVTELDAANDHLAALNEKVATENEKYTGWSRFYLVTSSPGHVHSTMACQTCNFRTRFGWVTELSGKTEQEAVSELGSNLCSVCFPSAPVEHQGGKITKAQAEKIRDGGLEAAREIMGKNKAAQADVCPGSGKAGVEPIRQGYAAGNYVSCPECKAHVGGKGYTVRKHKPGGGRA